jgi:uncharacterized protein YqeY
MLEKQIEQDLKIALLAKDHVKVDTLRGLKSALLYAKVEKGKRDSGLTSEEEIAVLSKESKKRSESAELYIKGGNQVKAQQELLEKEYIDVYLPKQLSVEEVKRIVIDTISVMGVNDMASMGRVIAEVKQKTAGAADGGLIAKLVKESLS